MKETLATIALMMMAGCSALIGVEDTEIGVPVRVLAVAPGVEAGDVYSGDQRVATVSYGQLTEPFLASPSQPLAIRAAGAPIDTAPLVEANLVDRGSTLRTAVWTSAADGTDHQLVELVDAPVGQLRISHMIPGLEDLDVSAAGATLEISQLNGVTAATDLSNPSVVGVETTAGAPIGTFAVSPVSAADGPLHMVMVGDPAQRLPFPEALSLVIIDRSGIVQTALTEPVIYATGAIPEATGASLRFRFVDQGDRTVNFGHAELARLTVAAATIEAIEVEVDGLGINFGQGLEIERGRDYLFLVAGSPTSGLFALIAVDALKHGVDSAVLGLNHSANAPTEPLAAELVQGGATIEVPEWSNLARGTLVTPVDVDPQTSDLVVVEAAGQTPVARFSSLPFAPGDRSYAFVSGQPTPGYQLLVVDAHTLPWSLRLIDAD